MLLLLFSLLALASEPDSRPVLVIVGMGAEAKIAAGQGAIVVSSAGDAALLHSRLAGIGHDQVRAVISFGIAGALDPALQSGDALVGGRVVGEGQKAWPADSALSAYLRAQSAAKEGTVLAHDGISEVDAASRAAARATTGADIVDEESHIAAALAESEGLPFSLIRAVADPASSTLPPAATLPLNADGEPDTTSILFSLLRHPWQISDLLAMKQDFAKALDALRSLRSHFDWIQAPGAAQRAVSSISRPPYPRALPKNRTVPK
jgi:adenosylhomocysteine nucleosidase